MKDLESGGLFRDIQSFADRMRTTRANLAAAKRGSYEQEEERRVLDAVDM